MRPLTAKLNNRRPLAGHEAKSHCAPHAAVSVAAAALLNIQVTTQMLQLLLQL